MESTMSGEASASAGAGAGEQMHMQEREKQTTVVKKMKVMVAIDESDESSYALKWALDYLFPVKGAPATVATAATMTQSSNQEELPMVYLVHVTQPFQNFIYPAGPVAHGTAVYATTTVLESVRKAQEENAAVLMCRALQMCKDNMVKAETLILNGDAKDMICQAADQIHVDILIVGSRGLGKIKRAFLGSVSDYCAHHAKCPILIVKPPKEFKESSKESKD